MSLRAFVFRTLVSCSAWSAVGFPYPGVSAADIEPSTPTLVRTRVRLEPTEAQLASVPRQESVWILSRAAVDGLPGLLRRGGFREEVVTRLVRAFHAAGDDLGGEATWLARPDAALLDAFDGRERAQWHLLLASNASNRGHRWPLSVPVAVLERMEADPALHEAAQRVRRWGIAHRDRVLFGEMGALESAFGAAADRAAFFRACLGVDALMVKLGQPAGAPGEFASAAAYWQVQGRYSALQPFLDAVASIEDKDRIDIAHLLPRLPRATLYTFPPDFGVASDPALENALLAIRFFDSAPVPESTIDGGFSGWLAGNTVPLEGEPRFGDIVTFEDPARTRWPYCLVHVADGVFLGRLPARFAAWTFLSIDEVRAINPRLSSPPRWFRRSDDVDTPALPRNPLLPVLDVDADGARRLESAAAGPWGEIFVYDVRLAPPTDLIETLPVPRATPEWVFRGVDRRLLSRIVDEEAMPPDVRLRLLGAIREADELPGGGVRVLPPLELVFDLPAAVRARLYQGLETGGLATDYAQDVVILADTPPGQWRPHSATEAELLAPLSRLSYPRGGAWALADYGALFHAYADPVDRTRVFREVFRSPAVVALLAKPAPEEAARWAEYWSRNQQKDVRALLESFALHPTMRHLDVVHLLPPLAREFSNLYQMSSAYEPAASCYWTSLNFDAASADRRLLVTAAQGGDQARQAAETLAREYVVVPQADRLGDVLAYRDMKSGEVVHLCSFVAADVVFTKNGFGFSAPWCLMRLRDVDRIYLQDGLVLRSVHRLRSSVDGSERPARRD